MAAEIKKVLLEDGSIMYTNGIYEAFMEAIKRPGYKPSVLTEDDFDDDEVWEDLAEEIEFQSTDDDRKLLESSKDKKIKPGDIIMTRRFYSPSFNGFVDNKPHRILVVTDSVEDNGTTSYNGYVLSSKYNKSNKYLKSHPDKLYIENYGTILEIGPKADVQAAIDISDLVTFTDKDLSNSGFYKGTANQEFIEFIKKAAANVGTGKNKDVFWIK